MYWIHAVVDRNSMETDIKTLMNTRLMEARTTGLHLFLFRAVCHPTGSQIKVNVSIQIPQLPNLCYINSKNKQKHHINTIIQQARIQSSATCNVFCP